MMPKKQSKKSVKFNSVTSVREYDKQLPPSNIRKSGKDKKILIPQSALANARYVLYPYPIPFPIPYAYQTTSVPRNNWNPFVNYVPGPNDEDGSDDSVFERESNVREQFIEKAKKPKTEKTAVKESNVEQDSDGSSVEADDESDGFKETQSPFSKNYVYYPESEGSSSSSSVVSMNIFEIDQDLKDMRMPRSYYNQLAVESVNEAALSLNIGVSLPLPLPPVSRTPCRGRKRKRDD